MNNYRSNSFDDTKISFPKLESWNPLHEIATIAIDVDKRRVLCRISKEVLASMSSDKSIDPMVILSENRPIIEAKARELISQKAYEDDGSITING